MNVRLTWTANTEPDLDHYLVYYGPTPSFGSTVQSPTNTLDINGLPDGVTMYFAVTAFNASGDQSTQSSTVNIINKFAYIRH